MKKKAALIAAAGLLATATIVTATTLGNKKAVNGQPVKTEAAKEKKECSYQRTHCFD